MNCYNKIYDKIYDTLKTGDLIIFSGNNNIISCAVKIALWSKWTHIGIVVRDPDFLIAHDKKKGLYLLNSDWPYEKDIETVTKRNGVQLVDLRKKIESYDGHIVLRRLISKDQDQDLDQDLDQDHNADHNADQDRDNKYRNMLIGQIYKKLHGLPYDYGLRNTLNIILNNNKKNCFSECLIKILNKKKKQNIERFCCSGFVGYMYSSIGFFKPNMKWDICTPEYFTRDDIMRADISKNSTFYLAPMILIKNNIYGNCKL